MRRYEQLSLLLGDLIATHHTNYNGDGKPGFGITTQNCLESSTIDLVSLTLSGLKTLRFLRRCGLNIPITRVPGRNPVAKNGRLLSLSFNKLLKRLRVNALGFAKSPRTFL
ncbi:MAG: hypothetical protein HC789_23235 [Microcoleus sp. CSU_2_2]|nr:hypothetical protein [Microcoleus sp. CSU_2_2]